MKRKGSVFLAVGLFAIAFAPGAVAQTPSSEQHQAALPVPTLRDGQHDFDFEHGTWKIHLSRRVKRLEGSNEWVEFDGTSVTKPLWGGKSNIEQFESDSPTCISKG